MKTRLNIFANTPAAMAALLASLLLSGCYTQFSRAGQPEDQAYYEAYPEESGAYENDSYENEPLESPGYAAAYEEESGYRENEPDRVIINKYYVYDEAFGVYYNPPVYDPDPYVSVSFHFSSGYSYGYYSGVYGYPSYYWYPHHWRVGYYYPAYWDFGFYFSWGYWDPWYATIYYPPVVILVPPYYPYPGWCPPYYDPWYSGHHGHHGGHHSDPGYGNDPWPTGPRDWGRRDPVVAGNSGRPGSPGAGSHGGSNNGGGNLKSPQRGAIQVAGPSTQSQRSPRNPSSGQHPGVVNSGNAQKERRRETTGTREPVNTPAKKNPRRELGTTNAAAPSHENTAGSRFNTQSQERRPAQPAAGNGNNSRNNQQAGQQTPAYRWSQPLEAPKPVSQPETRSRSNDSGSSNGALRQPAAPQRNSENSNSNSSSRTENRSSNNGSSRSGSSSYQPQPSRSAERSSSAPSYRSQPAPRSTGSSSVRQAPARPASGKSESGSQKPSRSNSGSSDRAKKR